MSHFCLMVVTDEEPTDDVLTKAMQPFHEFECTGIDDEYIQDVDKTEEYRKDYESETTTKLRDPDGKLHTPYDDKFYRDPLPGEDVGMGSGCGNGISWTSKDWGDGKGYRPKVKFVPDGWEKVEIKTSDTQSFLEYCCDMMDESKLLKPGQEIGEQHKYGRIEVDGALNVVRVIDRTNPNKEWDYWRVGGRYRARFQVKQGCASGVKTAPSWEWKYEEGDIPDGCDKAMVGDLDLDRMKQEAIEQREKWVQECQDKAKMTRDEFAEALVQAGQAHEVWAKLEEPRPRGSDFYNWMEMNGYPMAAKARRANFEIPEPGDMPLDDWIQAAPRLSAFAVLMDGKWYERGEMGWWGVVHDEKDMNDWMNQFDKLFDSLRPDQWISMLDCHI